MTQDQKKVLGELSERYGLDKSHFHVHKSKAGQIQYVIVNKIGIEKIIEIEKIAYKVDVIKTEENYSAVSVAVWKEFEKTHEEFVMWASASPRTSTSGYYLEMAIKRAKAKAVLELIGAYQKGFYAEHEADEFDT